MKSFESVFGFIVFNLQEVVEILGIMVVGEMFDVLGQDKFYNLDYSISGTSSGRYKVRCF